MNRERLYPKFKYEIARENGGENIKACFACGICTASCPIREIDQRYNPRRIIRMVLLGMRERVLASEFIWFCSTCYACTERCPQGVRFTDVINAIKNRAVRDGHIHPSFALQIGILKNQCRLYEIDDFDNSKRQALGLPLIEKVKGFTRKIIALTGLDRYVPADSTSANKKE